MNNEMNLSLLKRPIFLSSLPVEGFKSLPKSYLFAEIARLDRLLESYPELISVQTDMAMVQSLSYCQNVCESRYDSLRKLLSNWSE